METSQYLHRSLQHRGKKGGWNYKDNDVVIGQVNSDETLISPIINKREDLCISFDGRIYNSTDLVRDPANQNQFHGVNTLNQQQVADAQLILGLYEKNGPQCLTKLNGKFAFCLWDSTNQLLFLARDRIGIKPMYYFQNDDQFIAASEIKGILVCPGIPRHPNEQCIYEYLIRNHPTSPEDTYFQGINALPPATYLVFNNGAIITHNYWTPCTTKYDQLSTDENFNKTFNQLFQDAISLRLPVTHPFGTYVSGGLDSTLIAYVIELMKREHKLDEQSSTHQLFSAIYSDRESSELKTVMTNQDERHAISELTSSLHRETHYVYPTITGKWSDLTRFIRCVEEPVAVLNYFVFWSLFQHSQSINVVFHGEGADTLFGGTLTASTRLKEAWDRRAIIKLVMELWNSRGGIIPTLLNMIYFDRKLKSDTQKLLQPDFAHRHENTVKPIQRKSLQDTIQTSLRENILECLRVNDRATSLFNLDIRYPYLDHRLVEFGCSLPSEQRFRKGYTKYILRNAMSTLIPDSIQWNRKKSGTPIPTKSWLTELEPQIETLLRSEKLMVSQYVDTNAIAKAFEKYYNNEYSRFEEWYYGMLLWKIMNLELWLRAYFVD